MGPIAHEVGREQAGADPVQAEALTENAAGRRETRTSALKRTAFVSELDSYNTDIVVSGPLKEVNRRRYRAVEQADIGIEEQQIIGACVCGSLVTGGCEATIGLIALKF